MDVRVDPSAAEFALQRGGKIYIWVGDSGFLHVATTAPDDSMEWQPEAVAGVTVLIASSATGVEYWKVELGRFPRRRLRGVSNMTGTASHESGWFGF
jgi:hypothetical protein